ncbi:hypothetical protein SteCoe_31696 [Stentor coeruleus]|uniref:START domain-containing protein n=1 Tax=Stentor coeruleus TaxID=5963 RepID=A0A1R2B0P1_9CILI|nr:hypothetical protein SteCoe_31696 [Stentor coeruleus]
MEILLSDNSPVMDAIAQSIKYFLKGESEEAFKLLIELEDNINELKASEDSIPELPEWFYPWKKAILRKETKKAKSLPTPPQDFLQEYHIKIHHLLKRNPDTSLEKILDLYNDAKLDEAMILLQKLRNRHPNIYSDNPIINELESDHGEITKVMEMITEKEGWHTECSGNITVRYKSVEGTRTYSLLTEAELDVPLNNYLTLIYESDLYHNWVPFCKKSYTVANLSKSKKIVTQEYHVKLIAKRHTCLYGFGVNMLSTKGCVVIYSRSCDQEQYFKGVKLPEFTSTRAQVNVITCIIRPITLNKIHITLLSNYDPNVNYVPYRFLNFFSRKLAKGMFKRIAKLAVNFAGSEYEKRIKAEESREFYDYLEVSQAEYLKQLAGN